MIQVMDGPLEVGEQSWKPRRQVEASGAAMGWAIEARMVLRLVVALVKGPSGAISASNGT